MSKRLTDTDKWKKLWFRKLKPEHKIFWQYLLDTCNNAGIWEVDFEMASFMIGCDVDPEEIKQLFSKQYRELDDGKRWFIEDFIEFQYKCSIQDLNPGNKAHLSVIRILEKHNIKGLQSPLEGANQKQEAPIQGALDKDMDKEKDKDKKRNEECGTLYEECSDWDYDQAEFWIQRLQKHFPTVLFSRDLIALDIFKLRTEAKLSEDKILAIQKYLKEPIEESNNGFSWFDKITLPGRLFETSSKTSEKFYAMILRDMGKSKKFKDKERTTKEREKAKKLHQTYNKDSPAADPTQIDAVKEAKKKLERYAKPET